MKYKNMYSVGLKKPNDNTIFLGYYGANSEEEAKSNAIACSLEFHNKYFKNKLSEKDFTVIETKLAGDFESVLADLQRG